MVYLALGVLAITLSATVYKYRFSTNSQGFLTWKSRQSLERAVTSSPDSGRRDDDDHVQLDVPTFTLDDGEHEKEQTASAQEQIANKPSTPDMKPAVAAQPTIPTEKAAMLPPTRTNPAATRKVEKQTPSPMAPPPCPNPTIINPTFKVPPKPSTSLRPPPSAASTLRAPPSSSLKPSTSSLAPSTSTLAPSARPSRKVLLDPGHSPLDWAHLTANPPTPTFLRGADVPPNLIRVPPSALRYHTGRKGKDAWGVYQGKVYNLSPYMKFHPGGVDQLMRGAGKETEGEKLFNEIHPWVSWENMLGECLIGILVSENEVQGNGTEHEDEMEKMD